MGKNHLDQHTVCRNRKATHRYEILEKIECGMVLLGTEIKSLRDRGASLDEAYARIDGGELWLVDFHIPAYKFGHTTNHEPTRRRKLLVHAHQLRKLTPKLEQKGQTLVPLRVYFNDHGYAKVTLGLGRGKRQADKRQDLRTRDHRREIEQTMQRRR